MSGKHMKSKSRIRNAFILALFSVYFLCSCHSNKIEYDLQTNTVYTVENYPIQELNINMLKSQKSFWITKIDTLQGSSCIKLDSLGVNYNIVETSNRLPFQNENVKIPFVPNETYEIYHASIGDASACTIYINTNERGNTEKVMTKYEYMLSLK